MYRAFPLSNLCADFRLNSSDVPNHVSQQHAINKRNAPRSASSDYAHNVGASHKGPKLSPLGFNQAYGFFSEPQLRLKADTLYAYIGMKPLLPRGSLGIAQM